MNYQKSRIFLSKRNIWNIISISVAILGIVLSIYFYLKSNKSKLPNYAIMNENIINDLSSKVNQLNIYYKDKKINNFSVCKFAFWNAGSQTINGIDIAKADPIAVNLKQGREFLGEPLIIFPKTSPNQFSVNIDRTNNLLIINFDYIDKDEGVIVMFYHTGFDDNDVSVTGIIKGFGKIINYKAESFYLPSLNISQVYRIKSIKFHLFFICLIILTNILFISVRKSTKAMFIPVNIGMFVMYFYFIYYFYKLPNFMNFFVKEVIK